MRNLAKATPRSALLALTQAISYFFCTPQSHRVSPSSSTPTRCARSRSGRRSTTRAAMSSWSAWCEAAGRRPGSPGTSTTRWSTSRTSVRATPARHWTTCPIRASAASTSTPNCCARRATRILWRPRRPPSTSTSIVSRNASARSLLRHLNVMCGFYFVILMLCACSLAACGSDGIRGEQKVCRLLNTINGLNFLLSTFVFIFLSFFVYERMILWKHCNEYSLKHYLS